MIYEPLVIENISEWRHPYYDKAYKAAQKKYRIGARVGSIYATIVYFNGTILGEFHHYTHTYEHRWIPNPESPIQINPKPDMLYGMYPNPKTPFPVMYFSAVEDELLKIGIELNPVGRHIDPDKNYLKKVKYDHT